MNFYQQVYEMVKKIPRGKVSTYGRIAVLLGKPRAARAVGYALEALKKENLSTVPWQRVINSKGQITFKGDLYRANLQKEILLKEGVFFDDHGTVNLNSQGWP